MHSFHLRLSATGQHLKTVGEVTMTRLTNIEAKFETLELDGGGDAAARARITELENTIRRMHRLFNSSSSRRWARPHRQSTRTWSSSAASSVRLLEGSWRRHGLLEEAWANQMLPDILKHDQLIGYEVFRPYMLSSVLFARCPASLAARRFVALLRRLRLQAKVNDVTYDIRGSLQRRR